MYVVSRLEAAAAAAARPPTTPAPAPTIEEGDESGKGEWREGSSDALVADEDEEEGKEEEEEDASAIDLAMAFDVAVEADRGVTVDAAGRKKMSGMAASWTDREASA